MVRISVDCSAAVFTAAVRVRDRGCTAPRAYDSHSGTGLFGFLSSELHGIEQFLNLFAHLAVCVVIICPESVEDAAPHLPGSRSGSGRPVADVDGTVGKAVTDLVKIRMVHRDTDPEVVRILITRRIVTDIISFRILCLALDSGFFDIEVASCSL